MKPICSNCGNKGCLINQYVQKEWQDLLAHQKSVIKVKANQKIIYQDSTVTGIYFICSGKFKVFIELEDNQYQIVRFARSGEILGHRGYSEDMKYHISATALVDSTLCYFPNELFFKTLKANPDLCFHLMMFFAHELTNSEMKITRQSNVSAQTKVVDAILWLIKVFGFDAKIPTLIDVPAHRKDLSAVTGMRYETLLRVLSELTKKKIISYKGDKFRVLNLEALKKLAL